MTQTSCLHNIVSAEFTEPEISVADIDSVFDEVESLSKKHSDIKLMILLGHHEKVGLKASIETFKRTFQLVDQIKKVVVISRHNQFLIATLDNLICPWEEKYFNIDDMDKAWEWLKHDN
jgi:hypothetical protein